MWSKAAWQWLMLLPLLCCSSQVGVAAPPQATPVPARETQNLQQARAACLAGASAQEPGACLKEWLAARASARRGELDNGESPAALQANALRRCERVPPADRNACRALARHEGSVSGTVGGGGQIRRIAWPEPPASAAPPASASPPASDPPP
ncbi:MAG: hypothetical protein CFE41_05265 [Burkholderiales bacterium PBB2]|nr:MAG: hypothetical protein CFE41_05265 [Burkholderiales bacterium PBB2]